MDEHTDPDLARYDMIIGTDLLKELKMELSFKDNTMTWEDTTISMKDYGTLSSRETATDLYEFSIESAIIKQAEQRHKEILDADYSPVNIEKYVDSIPQLTPEEKKKLIAVLIEHQQAFKGGLGKTKIKPIHLELKPGAQPYHTKAFPIPKAYEKTTRKESRRFESEGIWYHNSDTEWAAPSFIQPKKTGDVRVLTDFRELNKLLIRKPYPLPVIQDLLQKLERFKYAMALDLSMGYYHIPLDEYSQMLCTTILPWGKYSYAVLPMGVACSPDIFEKIIMNY